MYSDVNDRTTDEIQLAQDPIAFDSYLVGSHFQH